MLSSWLRFRSSISFLVFCSPSSFLTLDAHTRTCTQSVRARQVQALLREEKDAAAARLQSAEELRVAQLEALEVTDAKLRQTTELLVC